MGGGIFQQPLLGSFLIFQKELKDKLTLIFYQEVKSALRVDNLLIIRLREAAKKVLFF